MIGAILAKRGVDAGCDAQAIELQWTLLGLETGELLWFRVHVGGARDVERMQ